MTTRKSHTKSRSGCLQCKQRRVKCDEDTPSCGYCAKRQISCSLSGQHNNPETLPLGPGQVVAATSTSPAEERQKSRSLDLRLMHNWSTSTYISLSQHADAHRLWQHVVPTLAFTHEYLLDSLLALSAWHLRITDADNATRWEYIALDYQTRAIKGLWHVLSHDSVSLDNYEAVFACSTLLLSSTHHLYRTQPGCTLSDVLLDMTDVRQNLHGVGAVHKDYASQLRAGDFGILFKQYDVSTPVTPGSRWSDSEANRSIEQCFEKITSTVTDTEPAPLFDPPISELRLGIVAYFEGGIWSKLITWPWSLEDGQMALLQQQHPGMLLLLGLYGIILHGMQRHWWVNDAGKRLVKAIVAVLLDGEGDWAQSLTAAFGAMTGYVNQDQ